MVEDTPRRRSSRLHSRGTTPSRIESTPTQLSSVLEREESPQQKLQNIDELLSSSTIPASRNSIRHYPIPGSFDTPPPPQRIRPSIGEMHPSKVQQSTIKQPEAIDAPPTAPAAKNSKDAIESTPAKKLGSLPAHMSSPGFDFSFTRPESDLSEEAQKIMDSVREEAARIKARMQAELDEDQFKTEEGTKQLTAVEGRKIAQPRSGRYSDVHKQQFKKMDSIANHISTWKTKIQSTATAPTTSSSLKRSSSKAGLDKAESGIPRSKSFKALPKPEEVNATSGKRVKRTHDDDASQTRPFSYDSTNSYPTTPAKPQPTTLPSAVTTPTRASLARSASVKPSKTSMIPSLSRSASTKTLGTPQTEGSNKYMSRMAKFSPIKSILHRSQPKFSDDPVKVAAGTHLPLPTKVLSLNKDLPDLPGTPSKDLLRSPSVKKHVNFTPSTKPLADISPVASPSPSKIPRSGSTKALDSLNVTHRNTHKIPTATISSGLPGDFTFSSSKTIDFGPATSGLIKTIRPVRPSGFPTPLAETAFENHNTGGTIEHGIGNKKRKHEHEGSDTEGNQENVDPSAATQSPSKRVRIGEAATTPSKKQGMVKTPKGKGKGGKARGIMSLGRLNALARPKER
ncbi:MAG: hypothetical protein L6R40_005181 [Gallowayella cf. fulva]|nr:MAG: hypothetical protein L6R40_005181 [Xanthomendoza cf. fulva]